MNRQRDESRASKPSSLRLGEDARPGSHALLELQQQAGNAALSQLMPRRQSRRPEAGARHPSANVVLQRERRAEALRWLRSFLSSGGSATAASLGAGASRLSGWSVDRRVHLLRQVRPRVDAFEVALSGAGLLHDPSAGPLLGLLEGAQTNADLGRRLVTLFQASVSPTIGLVIAANLDQDRLRTVLDSDVRAPLALGAVLRRNPVAGLPAGLLGIRAVLARWEREFLDTSAGGVTASTPGREARIEAILTPPAVAHARAAAAAAGLPPPAFIPANYYEDLAPALHAAVQSSWAWANPMNSRRTLDTSAGGHVEGIATEAKARVDALFGDYGSRPAPSLTFAAGNLEDRGTITGDAFDMARWFVREGSGGGALQTVKDTHHAFEDTTGAAIAVEDRLISDYSGRTAPAKASERAALAALGVNAAERTRRLLIIDRMWPGVQSRGTVSVAAREGANRRETRGIYWGLFKTMIHEYLHSAEHGTYQTWYSNLRDSHHQTTYQEGFTDLFTLKTWKSLHPTEIAANLPFRRRIQGANDPALDFGAVGGAPGHYAELAEAQQIESEIGVANMKAAYFRGNTAVLGGGRLPR